MIAPESSDYELKRLRNRVKSAFVGAAALTNSDTASRQSSTRSYWSRTSSVTGLDPSLAQSRRVDLIQSLKSLIPLNSRLMSVLATKWINLSESKRTQLGLISIFSGIFIVWNIPMLTRFSMNYLWHSPTSHKNITLLTSVFAHKSLPHIAFNSIALYSIGSSCMNYFDFPHNDLLKRSTSRYEYLALFIGAGLFSSLISHLASIRSLLRLTTSALTRPILPSLGASGAIYSTFVITALAFPQASVALIFLPFVPIPIGAAAVATVSFDIIGILRGWQTFDHVAHLSGAFFGLFYFYLGHEWFERLRSFLLSTKSDGRSSI